MSSPPSLPRVSSFRRRSSFLVLQDDPMPLTSKGQGSLMALIQSRLTDEADAGGHESSLRRPSTILDTPQMRSMRLIGNSNPRYQWGRYYKTEDQLRSLSRPLRRYYERTNLLIQQYLYIDSLLDSSLPHDLLNEYNGVGPAGVPAASPESSEDGSGPRKIKRTPRDIYRPSETTPLFASNSEEDGVNLRVPRLEEDDHLDSGERIVTIAIYVNFAANAILLAGKAVIVFSVPSVSVLASLVDAVLDFLSTAIVWTTTWLISRHDQYSYPVGRRRLEPLGVLVFSVIMIVSFVQVMLQALQRLWSPDRDVIELGIPALSIMLGTIVIKGLCWLWCRLIRNSSVQALASDAATDVIFNAGSIAFPIVGFYTHTWWLDALGGLLLSLVVIHNWSLTSATHIRRLTGFSATADQRNILLYLTMRFAKSIKQVQGLEAYYAGDRLHVEVDVVLDENTPLKDSHDLCESLQYVLESVPIVDRAFLHADYAGYNLPTHLQQQPT